ncbi:MAG TPA: type IV pilus twitching motility protein PilT [Patescibacteria group bacterium]|nr:type IV pilus twitching motility protein PilT [Patescibacteria group bacterium]
MEKEPATIQKLLEYVVSRDASDLHLVVGIPPTIRVDGELTPVPGEKDLTAEAVEKLTYSLLTDEQKELLLVNKEVDFSFALGEVARFRVNAYHQKGYVASALRLIPMKIRTIDELNLPKICHTFAKLRQGFILVTGPTGHGKSTSLAAMIDEINQRSARHIVTIEDPIEYVYPVGKSLVSQRELHLDTHSWEIALRSALREDPDVVLIGEMRDYETIAAALTIAETGHLVFATLHTNNAAQTVDRIVDVFPEYQQAQVRIQLSNTLEGVISQRLLPMIGSGRVPATEILLGTPAVKTTVREGKTHLIDNIIQTSRELGMETLEMSLARLVQQGKVSLETAQAYSLRPEEVMRYVQREGE